MTKQVLALAVILGLAACNGDDAEVDDMDLELESPPPAAPMPQDTMMMDTMMMDTMGMDTMMMEDTMDMDGM